MVWGLSTTLASTTIALVLALILFIPPGGPAATGTRPGLVAAAEMNRRVPVAAGFWAPGQAGPGGEGKKKKHHQQHWQIAGAGAGPDTGPAKSCGEDQAVQWKKRKKPKKVDSGGVRDEDGWAWARGGSSMQALFQTMKKKTEAAAPAPMPAATESFEARKKQKKKKCKRARDLPHEQQQMRVSKASSEHAPSITKPPAAAGSQPTNKQKRKRRARYF